MFQSPNLMLNLIAQNQSQKEVTINEAVIRIDALLNNSIIEQRSSPPVNAKNGDLYIVSNESTEDWKDHEDKLAYYYGKSWHFITPKEGCFLWSIEKKSYCIFQDGNWQ